MPIVYERLYIYVAWRAISRRVQFGISVHAMLFGLKCLQFIIGMRNKAMRSCDTYIDVYAGLQADGVELDCKLYK